MFRQSIIFLLRLLLTNFLIKNRIKDWEIYAEEGVTVLPHTYSNIKTGVKLNKNLTSLFNFNVHSNNYILSTFIVNDELIVSIYNHNLEELLIEENAKIGNLMFNVNV